MGGKSWQPGDEPAKPKKLEKPELIRNPAPQKSDDEHLAMVPLSGDKTGTYDTGKRDSSTSFFAIPGASKKAPVPGPPVIGGPSAGPAPVAPIAGPVPVGPMAVGPQPVGGIAGPVAGGVGPGPNMAMGGAYNPAAIQEERSTSSRVFVMVAVLVMLVCLALVVSVGLLLFAFVSTQQEEPLELPTKEPQAVAVVRPPVDTGLAPAAKPKPKPTRPRSGPRPKSTPRPKSGPKPAAAAAVPVPAGPTGGKLSITKPASEFLTGFEIRCNAGFRRRASFNGNTASVADVPAEACTVTFKGGAATPKLKVVGGGSYNCSGSGSAMICRK